jgi:HEAT repeat protein
MIETGMNTSPQKPERELSEDEEIRALLADLHASRKEARAEAARRLGQVGTPALSGLMQALQDPDWVVRYRAAEALTAIADSGVDPALIASLGDERDHVRYMASKGLGIRKVKAALVPLIRTLRDENEFVRMCAARSLALLGNPRSIPALQERLEKEPVERVKEEMKKALARLDQS